MPDNATPPDDAFTSEDTSEVTEAAVRDDAVAPEDATARLSRLETILEPVSGGSPVGVDVRYEDAFQELKGEVDAAQSASGDPDFERVVALASAILTEESKDLTTACYLGLGLMKTEGLRGLGEGLNIVRLLSEAYWDDLYPPVKRMAARKNAIQLLVDRSREWLDAYKPLAADADTLQQIQAGVNGLEVFAGEKMADQAPVFSRLLQSLKTKKAAAEKPLAAKSSREEIDGDQSGEPAALETLADAANAVLAAAAFLRELDRTDARPYRLARAVRWGGLRALPPNQDGKTQLPPYIEQRKTYLVGLLEKADYNTIVNDAETSFLDAPFWLDLQRYLCVSMEALGEPFAAAREAVLAEVALLVHRFPDLPGLTFASGAPFADGDTHLWLDTRVATFFGSGSAEAGVPTDGKGDALEARYAGARELLAGGDLEGALALMAEGEAPGEAGRDGFRRQLYVADLCRQGGRSGVARAVLEGLDAEIDRAGVSAWEPALALSAWTALHACYTALKRDASKDEQLVLRKSAERLMEKVARLAPRMALTLVDKK